MRRLAVRIFAGVSWLLVLAWGLIGQVSQGEWVLEKLRSLGPVGVWIASHMYLVVGLAGVSLLAVILEGQVSRKRKRLLDDCRGLADEILGYASERSRGLAERWETLRVETETAPLRERSGLSERGRKRISKYMEEASRIYETRFGERVAKIKTRLEKTGYADERLERLASRTPANASEIEEVGSRLKIAADEIGE